MATRVKYGRATGQAESAPERSPLATPLYALDTLYQHRLAGAVEGQNFYNDVAVLFGQALGAPERGLRVLHGLGVRARVLSVTARAPSGA